MTAEANPVTAEAEMEDMGWRALTEVESGGAVALRGPGAAMVSSEEFNRSWRMAQALVRSGMFKDATDAAQAFTKIMLGRDLGLSPTQSMMGIYLVEGRLTLAANTLASFVKQSGHYGYKVVELSNERCLLNFYDYDLGDEVDEALLGPSEFTIEDAKRANLVKEKSGWVKYPRNMLFARALSNGVRWYCPDVTHGVTVYVEGEIVQEPTNLTAGSGAVEADYGDDPEVEAGLREVFGELEFTPAKQRTLLRGCQDQNARVALLAELKGQVPADADEVREDELDPAPFADPEMPAA